MHDVTLSLTQLLHHREHPTVSIYMPLQTRPDRRHENSIRWKNANRRAGMALRGIGVEATEFLAPLQQPVADALDSSAGAGGLVALLGASRIHVDTVPASVPELVVVADRFHLKPLLAASQSDGAVNVIALSLGSVHLLSGTLDSLSERPLPEGAPRSIEDVLPDGLGERRLQVHSTGHGGRAPNFHGQGLGEYRQQEDCRRFLRELDAALDDVFADESATRVVVGEPKLLSEFRSITRHQAQIDLEIPGGFDASHPDALLARMAPAIREQRRAAREAELDNASAMARAGRLSGALEDLLPAADDGRIDTLFLERGARCWGHYDRARRAVERAREPRAAHEDLYDLAAVRTLEHGGRVLMIDPGNLPGAVQAAALLRY